MTQGKVWEYGKGWREAEVAPIASPVNDESAIDKAWAEGERKVCEDDGAPYHYEGSVDDVPLWHPGERLAYGKFAELVEIEDDLRHAYD